MKRGTLAVDVICKENLELVIRTNGFAACVRPETAEKMQRAGMLFIPIGFTKAGNEIRNNSCIKDVNSKFLHYRS